jgi:hypothetical protein
VQFGKLSLKTTSKASVFVDQPGIFQDRFMWQQRERRKEIAEHSRRIGNGKLVVCKSSLFLRHSLTQKIFVTLLVYLLSYDDHGCRYAPEVLQLRFQAELKVRFDFGCSASVNVTA